MIPDESQERIAELWAHLFGDLDGYLVTFTGRQSAETGTQPAFLEVASAEGRSCRVPARTVSSGA